MTAREMAQALGRRGGRARAKRLSTADKKRIAALGARARIASLEAARRIETNFHYLAAVRTLQGGPKAVTRVNAFEGPLDLFGDVAEIASELADLGLQPILVGGMALVIAGSRRVTYDFDFVVTRPGNALAKVIDVLYDRGLELASRVDTEGDIVATIASRKVASIRLRIDAPSSAYFFNLETGLRIDLLFDFPIAASVLAKNAKAMKISSRVLHVASEEDLLRLKKIARAKRSGPGDAQDIAFLEARRKASK